jgi:hypothetical protein
MFISVKVNSWRQAKEIFAERTLWHFVDKIMKHSIRKAHYFDKQSAQIIH